MARLHKLLRFLQPQEQVLFHHPEAELGTKLGGSEANCHMEQTSVKHQTDSP